jgi:hypothetical protein
MDLIPLGAADGGRHVGIRAFDRSDGPAEKISIAFDPRALGNVAREHLGETHRSRQCNGRIQRRAG